MELFDYLKDLNFERELYYNITINDKRLKINDVINKESSFISFKSTFKDLKDLLGKTGVFLDISDINGSKENSILFKEFKGKKEIKINLMTKDNYVRLFFPFQTNSKDVERKALIKKLNNYSFVAFFNDKELDQEQSDFIRLSLTNIRSTSRNRTTPIT